MCFEFEIWTIHQGFDPIKYILQSIPDEGGDATYFDKQVSGGSLCFSFLGHYERSAC